MYRAVALKRVKRGLNFKQKNTLIVYVFLSYINSITKVKRIGTIPLKKWTEFFRNMLQTFMVTAMTSDSLDIFFQRGYYSEPPRSL